MFMRNGIVAGVGFTLQTVARLSYVIYYGFFYYKRGYYFSRVQNYPELVLIVILILLIVACFRRKMGIPMACISLTLIYAEGIFSPVVNGTGTLKYYINYFQKYAYSSSAFNYYLA